MAEYIHRIFGYFKMVTFRLILILSVPVFSIPAITDDDWTPMNLYGLPGVPGISDGTIHAIAWNNGKLYIGGDFSKVENIEAWSIAQWDGRGWSPVGEGFEKNKVDALCFDKRGLLYAGIGCVSTCITGSFHPVYCWDGHQWDSVGQRIPAFIYTLLCDDRNNLYAGGWFTRNTYNGVAKWDGSDWSKLDTGVGTIVNCLSFDKSGTLYAGGLFGHGCISRWDGEKWHPLGRGIVSNEIGVETIAFDTGGTLYAGGYFDSAGTVEAHHIAQWDGTEWHEVGGGVNSGVHAMISDGRRGGVIVGGQFHTTGNAELGTLVKWDGRQWKEVFGYASSFPVWALCSDNAENIYSSVRKESSDGTVLVNGPMKYDGSKWDGIGPGIFGSVTALTHDDNGNIYFAGKFSEIPGDTVNRNIVRIMKWDGTTYHLLGIVKSLNLQDSLYRSSTVTTLVFGKNGMLYAGGEFNHINDVDAYGIAFWDGIQWNSFGDAIGGNIASIGTFGDSSLLLCGILEMPEIILSVQAAVFNGHTWKSIGLKLPGYIRFSACTIDNRNNVYIANYSDSMSRKTVQHLAYVKGAFVTPVEPGIPNGKIYSLACDNNGNLYVGGQFDTAGNIAASNIAKWDGERWYPLGTGVNNGVYALEFDRQGNLYAGGWFDTAGGIFADHIARWDGNGWSAFGTGVNKKVTSLAVYDTVLYVGGEFDSAGSFYSPFLVKTDLHLSSKIVPKGHTVAQKPIDIRVSGNHLIISNGNGTCKVKLYSIEGRLLYDCGGATRVSLTRFAQQIIIVHFVQNGEAVIKRFCLYRH